MIAKQKHPKDYAPVSLGGLHVMQVDPGTKITDERTGKSEIITDECSIQKGNVLWCTKTVYEKLKKRIQ